MSRTVVDVGATRIAASRVARIAGLSATRWGVSRSTRADDLRRIARCSQSRLTRTRSSSIEKGFVR